VVLRGATQQILDESERSLHDALCVLQQTVKETRVVYGGGGWSLREGGWSLCGGWAELVEEREGGLHGGWSLWKEGRVELVYFF